MAAGQDLYDAALLAEYTTKDLSVVRDLLRNEPGTDADRFPTSTRASRARLALALDR